MENLSLGARHLLKLMQDGNPRKMPLRGPIENAAMLELATANLVAESGSVFILTHAGYDRNLTKI